MIDWWWLLIVAGWPAYLFIALVFYNVFRYGSALDA